MDIVERLRDAAALPTGLYAEAADEIEVLRKSVEYWKADSAAAWDKCEERRLESTHYRAVMEQALYVIEAWERDCDHADYCRSTRAITALREALGERT